MNRILFVATVLLVANNVLAEGPDGLPRVRGAVERSLAILESKGYEWETTMCVSCHHGPWMMWTG